MSLPSILLVTVLSLLVAEFAPAGSATWNSSSVSGDWNTATNWIPNTVPNGPSDTATFDFSAITDISTSDQTEVDSIVFNPGASAYTITVGGPQEFLFVSGTGIVNNSGLSQTFVSSDDIFYHAIFFFSNATAGNLMVFSNPSGVTGSKTGFLETSNAGNCTIVNGGAAGPAGGETEFLNQSSAANATIINEGAPPGDVIGGATYFFDTTTAGTATIINEGGTISGGGGGFTRFDNDATTADATVINNGGSVEGAQGGSSDFLLGASPGNATFIANGTFSGFGAGRIFFTDSVGGAPRLQLFGTGTLEISTRNKSDLTVGSIAGDGLVFLGANNLTVGSNNLSTSFSGVIQDGGVGGGTRGSLTKIGSGTLELTGANIYTGGTTVEGGKLVVNNMTGSGTGTGAVQVNAGRLCGRGTIAGAVTVGSGSGAGAALAPGRRGAKADTLTIQGALTFQLDSTYKFELKASSGNADKVVANSVTINGGALFSFTDLGSAVLPTGTVFTVISNTAATPISGAFSNLADDSIFTANGNNFQASYEGGDGNDLTLAVVP